jgi:uncharacterized repeat protein (TIGR01451 family)
MAIHRGPTILCALAATAAAPPVANAAQRQVAAPSPVALDQRAFVERVSTDVNGRARRTLAAANRLAPGDRLVFIVNYRNQGSAPVNGFTVTNPVPTHIRIAPAQFAAPSDGMQVSVDGGAHWGRLADFSLPTPLGGTRRATPEDVTHVRWTLRAIAPGDGGRIAWRAVVR